MFLRKNSRIEKKTHLQQLPQKNKPPTLFNQAPSRMSTIVQPPLINYQFKKGGCTENEALNCTQSFILVYVLDWKCLLCTRVEVKDTIYCWGSC